MTKPTKIAPLWLIILITPLLICEWVENAVSQWPKRVQGFFLGVLTTIGAIAYVCLIAMFS